jgi:TRAP-type mannitol/chloroaromatic compound transport system permease small subunit
MTQGQGVTSKYSKRHRWVSEMNRLCKYCGPTTRLECWAGNDPPYRAMESGEKTGVPGRLVRHTCIATIIVACSLGTLSRLSMISSFPFAYLQLSHVVVSLTICFLC